LRRGKAAESVGVDRHTINRAQQKDPDFAKACLEAEAAACDIIENVMWSKILDKGDTTLILSWLYNRSGKDANGEPRWADKRFFREPDKAKEQTIEELKAELAKRGINLD
jgi:hypothetical protein